jgi:hypothetical protein
MFRNLRLIPSVGMAGAFRHPRVEGKWMRKGDAHGWYFRLRIDGTGAVVKKGWEVWGNPAAAA